MYQEIEEKLKASKLIKFLPYVGQKYFETKNKILVLGESHFGAQEQNSQRDLTLDVFDDALLAAVSEGRWRRWFRGQRFTAAMITGERYHDSDYIWEELAFYNFFQEVVGVNAADKKFITAELIEKSRNAFFETLTILNPKIVIVWGESKMYWSWLPPFESRKFMEGEKLFFYEEFPSTFIWCIPHPSRGLRDNIKKEWEAIKMKYLVS